MTTYATPAELANHLKPEPTPPNGGRLLARASRRVDQALLCAVYPVDPDTGLPVKAVHRDALREATLEQISVWLANGDTEGLGVVYNDVKIGGVQLRRGGGGTDPAATAGGICPEAFEILTAAGLTGGGPRDPHRHHYHGDYH